MIFLIYIFVEPDIVVCEGEFCGIHAHLCASVWRKSSWLGVALNKNKINKPCMYRIRFALHLNIENGQKIKDAYWLIDLLGAFRQMGRDLVAEAKKLV